MEVTTTAERPFEKCYLDVVGPLPVTLEGNKYILALQDDLSKYVVAVPIEKQDAETVATAFVEKIVLTYGTPQILQTDQGANFTLRALKLGRFSPLRSTQNHTEILSGVTVCWLNTSDTM